MVEGSWAHSVTADTGYFMASKGTTKVKILSYGDAVGEKSTEGSGHVDVSRKIEAII